VESTDQPVSAARSKGEARPQPDHPKPHTDSQSRPSGKPSRPPTTVTQAQGDGADVDEPGNSSSVWVAERFEDFYEREFRNVEALIFALTGNRALAADATQEAFIAAWRNWQRISQYDKPGAWVRRVAVNNSRKTYRRATAELRALARLIATRTGLSDHSTTDLPGVAAEAAALWEAVRKLPRC